MTADPSAPAPPRGFSLNNLTRRSWLIIAAVAGVVLIAVGISVPVIAGNIARDQALAEYDRSVTAVLTAYGDLVAAITAADDSREAALVVYNDAGDLITHARPELVADAAVLGELQASRDELFKVAGLMTSEDGTVTAPWRTEPPMRTDPGPTPETTEELHKRIEELAFFHEDFSSGADYLTKVMSDIVTQMSRVTELSEDVVASGAEFAATVDGLLYADGPSVAALAAAAHGLTAPAADEEGPEADAPSSPDQRFATFTAAFDAAKASHEAALAAQEAARIEQAQRSSGGGGSFPRG